MSKTRVFFYGLFMDPDLLREQGYEPTEPLISKLENFELVLANRATLKPASGAGTWGTLMSLSDQELSQLYSAPSVVDYKAVDVICLSPQNEEMTAKVYILPQDYPLSLPENEDYAKKLHAICQKLSLPSSYSQKIENMISSIKSKNNK